jgi:hypothetical protein
VQQRGGKGDLADVSQMQSHCISPVAATFETEPVAPSSLRSRRIAFRGAAGAAAHPSRGAVQADQGVAGMPVAMLAVVDRASDLGDAGCSCIGINFNSLGKSFFGSMKCNKLEIPSPWPSIAAHCCERGYKLPRVSAVERPPEEIRSESLNKQHRWGTPQ